MRIHILNCLCWLTGVSGRLTVVGHQESPSVKPADVPERELRIVTIRARQFTGKCNFDCVCRRKRGRAAVYGVETTAIGVNAQSRAESLRARILIECATTSHNITHPVVESADSRVLQIDLRGLLESDIVCNFAKIPSFSVEQDLGAIDAIVIQRQRVHV